MQDETDNLARALRALLDEQFQRSPAFHAVARELARWILSRDEPGNAPDAAAPPPERVGDDPEHTGADQPPYAALDKPAILPDAPLSRPDLIKSVPLAIGGTTVHIEVPGSERDFQAALAAASTPDDAPAQHPRPDQIDLSMLKRRALLKARSCRLSIELRAARQDIEQESNCLARMKELIEEAQSLPDCFLWAFWKQAPQPEDAQLERIAVCYEALGAAAGLCRHTDDPRAGLSESQIQHAFCMFAEASSALRVALLQTWLTKPDRDQDESHLWLRDQTFTRQVFVPNYMTLGDPADPARVPELLAEIDDLHRVIENRQKKLGEVSKVINRIKYHAGRLPEDGIGDEHDCRKINEGIDELLGAGLPASDQRLRAVLAAVRPGHFPPSVSPHPLILDHDAPSPPDESPPARAWSASVHRVRALLEGGDIVVVGGERRNHQIENMKDAFALNDVYWAPLTEHGSGAPLRAPISRPETRMVVVLIKLAGHQHVDEARAYAREAAKPLVTITAGYNPEQIAEATLAQAAEQFAAASGK